MFNTRIFTLPCMAIFVVWSFRNPILTYCFHSKTSDLKYWNIYKIQCVWVLTYLYITFTGFLLILAEEITFLNVEYCIVVWASHFLYWPSWSPIVVYPKIVVCDLWPTCDLLLKVTHSYPLLKRHDLKLLNLV